MKLSQECSINPNLQCRNRLGERFLRAQTGHTHPVHPEKHLSRLYHYTAANGDNQVSKIQHIGWQRVCVCVCVCVLEFVCRRHWELFVKLCSSIKLPFAKPVRLLCIRKTNNTPSKLSQSYLLRMYNAIHNITYFVSVHNVLTTDAGYYPPTGCESQSESQARSVPERPTELKFSDHFYHQNGRMSRMKAFC